MDWAKQALRQRRLARRAREWAAIHEARADAYERRAKEARLFDGTAAGGRVTTRGETAPTAYPATGHFQSRPELVK